MFKRASAKAISQCAQKGQSGTRSQTDGISLTGVRRQERSEVTERTERERRPWRVEATTRRAPPTLKTTEITFTERLWAARGESQLSCELKELREIADALTAEMMEFGLLRPAIIKVSKKEKNKNDTYQQKKRRKMGPAKKKDMYPIENDKINRRV